MTKTYENIRKIATGQGDDYTTGCLLDYSYFKDHYKMIAIDLSKKKALDAVPGAIQQINFTENLDRTGNLLFKNQRNCFRLFTGNCKGFVNAIPLNAILLNTKCSLIFISIKRHNTIV